MKAKLILFELENDSGVERIFIIAKNKKRAVKLARKFTDLCDPDYHEWSILKEIIIDDPSYKEGLFEQIYTQ